MYSVSQTWTELLADPNHVFEVSLVVGESGRLITRAGDVITFGETSILVGSGGADSGYTGSQIGKLSTHLRTFPGRQPSVGACISAELDLQMIRPAGEIPRMAMIRPYVRVTDGETASEWIPQGIFYIDTRKVSQNDDGLTLLTVHAYDGMLMTEQDYPDTGHTWPITDTAVVAEIAEILGVGVDERTWSTMDQSYAIPAPIGYSMREVLGIIGAMYAGNWVMNYDGELLLIPLDSYPPETNYLVDQLGNAITFGGVRILV